jgi:hypothetical protein
MLPGSATSTVTAMSSKGATEKSTPSLKTSSPAPIVTVGPPLKRTGTLVAGSMTGPRRR